MSSLAIAEWCMWFSSSSASAVVLAWKWIFYNAELLSATLSLTTNLDCILPVKYRNTVSDIFNFKLLSK